MPEFYNPADWHWIVGGDETQFWSSKDRAYVQTLPIGRLASHIASGSELDEALAPYGMLGPTARRLVRKSVVQARLIDAGLMDAAYAALPANSAHFARWFAPDHPEVYAHDSDAIALLLAIGAILKRCWRPSRPI